MKDQLQTIRDAVNLLHPDVEQYKKAVDALAQLEAMVGEPYGTVTVVRNPLCVDMHFFYRHPEPPYLDTAAECHTVYTAAPVAQQPQDEPKCECNATMDTFCEVCTEYRKWKQPQAEPTDSMGIPLSCGKPLCSPGDHHPLCKLHKQPQAEAVPQGSKKQAAESLSNKSLAEVLRCDARGGVHANVWELDEAARRLEAVPQQAEAVSAEDYEQVLADHKRLVRELDVLLNGEAGAARQASLCDLVSQLKAQQPQAEAVPPDVVRDAAAYHWLTTTLTSPEPWVVFQKAFGHMTEERPPTKAELDAAIYAAIAQQKGPQP